MRTTNLATIVGALTVTLAALPTQLAAQSLEEARNLCSANPNCRVVKDDSQMSAFCVGNDCVVRVAARKAGKGQQEYYKVQAKDIRFTKQFDKSSPTLMLRPSARPVAWNGVIGVLSSPPPPAAPSPLAVPYPRTSPLKNKASVAPPPSGLLTTPRDAGSGLATGKRQHAPITLK